LLIRRGSAGDTSHALAPIVSRPAIGSHLSKTGTLEEQRLTTQLERPS